MTWQWEGIPLSRLTGLTSEVKVNFGQRILRSFSHGALAALVCSVRFAKRA